MARGVQSYGRCDPLLDTYDAVSSFASQVLELLALLPSDLEMQLSNLVVDGTAQDVLPGLPVMGRIPQAGEGEKGSDAAHAVPPLVYTLSIVQQPRVGAATLESAIGRLPIVPAVLVRLDISGSGGQARPSSTLRLFCSVSLLGEEALSIRSVSRQDPLTLTRETDNPLLGSLVRSPVACTDLNGQAVNLFVFDDVCTRMSGKYRLAFELRQAIPDSVSIAAVTSDVFDVVYMGDYPGLNVDTIFPDFSRHLQATGVSIYVPALAIPPPPLRQ